MTSVQLLEKSAGQVSNSWKPYLAYKPSGVEWLGDVPKHWVSKKVRFGFSVQLGKMLQPEANSETDCELPYLKAQHVQWDCVRVNDLPTMWATPAELHKYGVIDGDLLVCEGGEVGRGGIVCKAPDRTIIQNALHRVRPRQNNETRFLLYVLYHASSQHWFEILCNKATIAHFTGDKFGALGTALPPPPEQRAIASFLDRETGKIDRLVAKKRELIEKLKEERAALISRAVTRGLNPDAKLIPSGVEWLGAVPEHWGVKRLRFVAQIRTGNTPPKADEANYSDEGLLWVKPDNLDGLDPVRNTKEHLSDIGRLIARVVPPGTPLVCCIGSVGKFGVSKEEAAFNQQINAIVLNERIMLSRFALYLVAATEAEHLRYANLNVVPILNGQQQSNIAVPVPPVEEQCDIVAFLDQATHNFARLSANIEEAIARVQEYRASLITAAVTGKIDVREGAA